MYLCEALCLCVISKSHLHLGPQTDLERHSYSILVVKASLEGTFYCSAPLSPQSGKVQALTDVVCVCVRARARACACACHLLGTDGVLKP